MKTSEKKLVGLRRYHVNRPVKTRLKLLEALDRMESGHTVVVGPGFNWSKTVLAREAASTSIPLSGSCRAARGRFPKSMSVLRNSSRNASVCDHWPRLERGEDCGATE